LEEFDNSVASIPDAMLQDIDETCMIIFLYFDLIDNSTMTTEAVALPPPSTVTSTTVTMTASSTPPCQSLPQL